MGIPGFFSHYYSKYKFKQEDDIDKTYDSIFFDYNSLIHPVSQVVLKLYPSETEISLLEDLIIEKVIEYTLFNIEKYSNPLSNIFIYIDGVAPNGKLKQQRERRYKNVFSKKTDNDNELSTSFHLWDSNVISPSTLFMKKLRIKLDLLKSDKFLIDDDPSEAEHKIFKTLKIMSSSSKDNVVKKKILIYGLDADLIILSLLHTFYNYDIFLLRNNTIKTQDTLSQTRVLQWNNIFSSFVLNTSSFKKSLLKDIIPIELKSLHDSSILQDYVFISFLLGNDFIDHLPNLDIKKNGITILLKCYNKTLLEINVNNTTPKYLIDNDKGIYLPFLKKILLYLSNSEDYYFVELFRQKICTDFINLKNKNMIVYDDNLLVLNHPSYKQNYYKFYQIFDTQQVCHDYLKTLYWNYFYYFFHKHSNWSWSYTHYNAPFSSDFYNFVSNISTYDDYISFNFIQDNPLQPIEQLLSILPKKSLKNVLEPELYTKFLYCHKSIPYFKKCYPDTIFIDINNKQYFHESKILYEPININIITNLLNLN